MAQFQYTAVTKEGRKESATLEAGSLIAAGHLLKEQGFMPLELTELKENSWGKTLRSFGTVPLKEKIVFIENLGLMIKSGIAAPRALKILAHQTGNKRFQAVLTDLAGKVEAGKSLHESMAAHPKIFSYIFITMVKVGEVGGSLEKSLEHLSIQLEREADLRSKVKGAMIYPAVIVSAMLLVGVLMAIFVLPY
jgi:type IV pilus assembly protein PilC